MKRTPREPSILSESLRHQLNSYALAASAAGVGLLALAQPAEAKIVYTKAHKHIARNTYYQLDLTHDGKTEFTIANAYACPSACQGSLLASPSQGIQGVEGLHSSHGGWGTVYALGRGARIGPTRPFYGHYLVATQGSGCFSHSSWCNVTNRYVGLSFTIHGQIHYGWARLNVFVGSGIHALLTGYAYETVAQKPIIAGKTKGPDVITLEPASLGHLARGASAIPAWRGKD